MAAITRLHKADDTERASGTSATPAEEANYTVSWSDLTTAGFANGENVIIICKQSIGGSHVNALAGVGEWRIGSTFAGASVIAGSEYALEPQVAANSTRGHHHSWIYKVALTTNDNIYFGHAGDGTDTGLSRYLSMLILSLDDLAAGDWRYAEQTHSGNAPSGYDTSGASVTVPGNASANDWLLFASAHWLIDSVTADALQAISWGGSDFAESREQGEDTGEIRGYTVNRYVTGVTSNTVLQARYRADTATTHDCDMTRVFALRLSAFRDHAGVQDDSTTITHTTANTYQEFAGLPSYAHGGSGANDLFILAATTQGATGDTAKSPSARVQIAEANVFASTGGAKNHGVNDKITSLLFGMTSQTNGTLDIDADVQETVDVAPNPTHTYHVLAAWSAELATSTTPSQVTASVTTTIAQRSEVTAATSSAVARRSAITAAVASLIALVGQVTAAASSTIALRSEVTAAVSSHISGQSEVTAAASSHIEAASTDGQVTAAASSHIASRNEVTAAAQSYIVTQYTDLGLDGGPTAPFAFSPKTAMGETASEVTAAVQSLIALPSEVTAAVQSSIALRNEVMVSVESSIALPSEITAPVQSLIAGHGESTASAESLIASRNEVTAPAESSIALRSEVTAAAQSLIAQRSEVTAAASSHIESTVPTGEVSAAAETLIAGHGESTAVASSAIAGRGEVTAAAESFIVLRGEVTAPAESLILGHGEQTASAESLIARQSVVVTLATSHIGLRSESTAPAESSIAQRSEVTVAAESNIETTISFGEVTANTETLIKGNGEVTAAASTHIFRFYEGPFCGDVSVVPELDGDFDVSPELDADVEIEVC